MDSSSRGEPPPPLLWLLLRFHGPAEDGPELLVATARTRGQLGALLARRLKEAWDRQKTGAAWGFDSAPDTLVTAADAGLPAWAARALGEWEKAQQDQPVDSVIRTSTTVCPCYRSPVPPGLNGRWPYDITGV
eukprot:scaffold174816_cov44-Prasinocladus_malaysianus.AAC.1